MREEYTTTLLFLRMKKCVSYFFQDTEHAGIRTLRYIPARNAMGAHDDEDAEARNEENACYCLADQDFTCFKSGVLNMEPCKRETFAPLALSMPHFYQARFWISFELCGHFTKTWHGLARFLAASPMHTELRFNLAGKLTCLIYGLC